MAEPGASDLLLTHDLENIEFKFFSKIQNQIFGAKT
jgi:hypothetical protein